MLKIVAGIVIGGGGEPASANPEYKNCIDFACSVNILKNALTISWVVGFFGSGSGIGGTGTGTETVTFPDITDENPGCVAGNFNNAGVQHATNDAETRLRSNGAGVPAFPKAKHKSNAVFIAVSTNGNNCPP